VPIIAPYILCIETILHGFIKYDKISVNNYNFFGQKQGDLHIMSISKAFIIGVSDCGESVCAASGRISTQPGNCQEILNRSIDTSKNANLISKVTASGHTSTIEHIMFNLAFQDVSAVVEQFMIEFRLASFTVKSRRYVDFSNMGYYVPNLDDKDLEKEYKEHMNYLFDEYQFLLDNGVEKEDARFILPYCLHSNFFCSLNGREFLHILNSMLYGRGSKYPEIKELGTQLLEQAKTKVEGIFIDFEKRCEKTTNNDEIVLDFINVDSAKSKNKSPVELLSYTEQAEKCVAKNALITYSQISSDAAEKIVSNKDTVDEIIKTVVKSSRPRPLESVNFTFRLNDVSLPCLTHFARHRMQAIDIPPLTKANRENYIVPEIIRNNSELKKRYEAAFKRNAQIYKKLQQSNIAEEILVYYLLCGSTIDFVTTVNARELMLFFRLRTCTRAQWEIREYAIKMLQSVREVAPSIFNLYGPSCFVNGVCPESANFTCGRAGEMKRVFKAL
jgi:flavin-dependent thymidylate synthase